MGRLSQGDDSRITLRLTRGSGRDSLTGRHLCGSQSYEDNHDGTDPSDGTNQPSDVQGKPDTCTADVNTNQTAAATVQRTGTEEPASTGDA